MGFLWALIIGFVIGAIAKFVMPGRDPGGFIVTILLGIAGAEVATFLGRAVGWYGPYETSHFIGAVIGAVILLAIYRFIVSRRTPAAGSWPR
jgi:uncharacterized membrane protein YeaQ/YmgE (transglycosylase-associated protein family)